MNDEILKELKAIRTLLALLLLPKLNLKKCGKDTLKLVNESIKSR
jgi:hypothetical protein